MRGVQKCGPDRENDQHARCHQGGRAELGIGAGWKRDEWLAYGYGFPPPAERLAILRDHLEVLRTMMGPGHATYEGKHASVHNAIDVPKPLQQPWVPIMDVAATA